MAYRRLRVPEDDESVTVKVARIDERVAAISDRMGKLEAAVYGAAGIIVIGVLSALVALVVRSP